MSRDYQDRMNRMNRSNNSDSRIYIGNLPENVRARDVEDVFSKYGKITEVDIKMPRGGRGPAFAFLEFDDPRDAQDAVKGRDGYDFDGNRIRVEFPQARNREFGSSSGGSGGYRGGGYSSSRGRGDFGGGGRGRGRGGGPPRRSDYRVLISGLPATGSWQDIKDHCREAGDVVYADVFRDGTGVVEFVKRDDMEWAVKNLDDTKFKSHEGETAFIRVKQDGAARTSRSRSRSRSPLRRSYSRSRSRSTGRRSRSRSRSRSPRRSSSPRRY